MNTFIEKYIDSCIREGKLKPRSIDTYKTYLYKFYDWTCFTDKDIREIKTEDIKLFLAFKEKEGCSRSAASLWIYSLKSFYTWMVDNNYIKESPVRSSIKARGKRKKDVLVLSPRQIFKIRKKRNVKLRAAAAFETLLSTGMRVSELLQIRACDINLGDRPYDKELKVLSPYYSGSIYIDPRLYKLKGKGRRVYLSNLSREILLRHIKHQQIPMKSELPIFSWGWDGIRFWMYDLGEGVIEKERISSVKKKEYNVNRTKGYQDIDLSKITNPKLKERIKIKQKREKETLHESYQSKDKDSAEKKSDKLHPHAMRHTFTCVAWHRNPFGERGNYVRLSNLLGHSSSSDATMIYLSELDLIDNDETWKRVINGSPSDWFNLDPSFR